MENVVKHSRTVVEVDPHTNTEIIKQEKVWNYATADITFLAFGTSFPQISLATIDAIRNIGNLYAGGLGPGTLLGSAAFDLFPIHAVCVVVPKAGELKKISDIGVWLVELFWSFWAYAWLYIILEVWTPKVLTIWEALLTVLMYGLLLIHAYAQDKQREVRGLRTGCQQRLPQLAVRTMSMVGTLRYLKLKKTKMRKLLIFCPFIQKKEKNLLSKGACSRRFS